MRVIEPEFANLTGRYVFLKAFIDPGRNDVYLENAEGARLCLSACTGQATFSTGPWTDKDRQTVELTYKGE